jgi:hypothetical protein
MNPKYIEEFVRLNCSPDFLAYNLFPNAKEITESFACYDAVRQHVWTEISPSDPTIIFFAVGDGHVPRTGATFAMRTKWTCISIDPELRFGKKDYSPYPNINRLYTYKDKVENITEPFTDLSNRIVVIGLVHSHADVEKTYDVLKGRQTYIVSIPCCVKHNTIHGKMPNIECVDDAIWSTKNVIKIWKLPA